MLEGTLEVWLDEVECHLLEQGDSFWFESNLAVAGLTRPIGKPLFSG
jgi:hypothetical protein